MSSSKFYTTQNKTASNSVQISPCCVSFFPDDTSIKCFKKLFFCSEFPIVNSFIPFFETQKFSSVYSVVILLTNGFNTFRLKKVLGINCNKYTGTIREIRFLLH